MVPTLRARRYTQALKSPVDGDFKLLPAGRGSGLVYNDHHRLVALVVALVSL